MDLKEKVRLIREYQEKEGISNEELRFDLIELGVCEKGNNDILLSASSKDTEYIDLLCDLVPEMSKMRGGFKETRGEGYVELEKGIEKWLKSKGIESRGEREEEKEVGSNPPSSTEYIRELQKKGYDIVSDERRVGIANKVFTACLALFKKTYVPTDMSDLGYKDAVLYNQSELLESLGINAKKADIWEKRVFTKHEDLAFRLFVRESQSAYQFILKLPLGVANFELEGKGGQAVQSIAGLPMLFGGKCAYLNTPKVSNIKSSLGIDCDYDYIDFTIVKDFKAFKDEDWFLRDYIRQARGTDITKFKGLAETDGLPLGKKLTVGVYPGGLSSREFICTSDVSASIMCGGAGSGKTAMNDSILVQSLAYEGDGGDGATVLIDFKEEWVGAWWSKFKERGIPFYGFDGELIKDDLQMEQKNKKGEVSVVEIPFDVPMFLAGAIYLEGIYSFIQQILKNSGACENILDFNKRGVGYKSLKKLPRTTIILDEINSMYDYVSKNQMHKQIFKTGLIRAKLTRTSGYLWFLGGQDVSDTIIPKAEKGSYRYRITGSLAKDRYEYYGIKVNPAINAYAKKHGTADKPDPIMCQGMFYAGVIGQSDVAKCMYLPSSERGEALDDLKIDFEGMKQLHELTKLALEEGVFDRANACVGSKNNIVYAALKKLGVITDKEFRYYTERLFGVSEEEEGNMEEFHRVGIEASQGKVESRVIERENQGESRVESKVIDQGRVGVEEGINPYKLKSQEEGYLESLYEKPSVVENVREVDFVRGVGESIGVEGNVALDLNKLEEDIETKAKDIIKQEKEDLEQKQRIEANRLKRMQEEERTRLKEEQKLIILDARRRGLGKEEELRLLRETTEQIKAREREQESEKERLRLEQESEMLELQREHNRLLKELRESQEMLEAQVRGSQFLDRRCMQELGSVRGEVGGLRGYVEGVTGNIDRAMTEGFRGVNQNINGLTEGIEGLREELRGLREGINPNKGMYENQAEQRVYVPKEVTPQQGKYGQSYINQQQGLYENQAEQRDVNEGLWYRNEGVSGIREDLRGMYEQEYTSANYYEGKVYSESLGFKGGYNPFDRRNKDTVLGAIDTFQYMSKLVETSISEAFHGLDRVRTLHVSDSGIFINDIAFRPTIPREVIGSMPLDIRGEVARGNITEFLNFGIIYKMPNLNTIVIDDIRLAETRVRQELGIKRKETWSKLYKKKRGLLHLEIGGSRITTPEEARRYAESGGGAGYSLQERLREVYSIDSDMIDRVKSPIKKAMRSKPVTIVTGAMGATLGTKAVLGVASMMGAWGVMFAGLTGYGAYKSMKK